MGDDEGEPRRYTKAWIRANWDDERETAPAPVQIVKLGHEWHIAALAAPVGLIAMTVAILVDAPPTESVLGAMGASGLAFKTFFDKMWCSTLAAPVSTESTADAETTESRTDETEERRQ
jgi:hypothetical protein